MTTPRFRWVPFSEGRWELREVGGEHPSSRTFATIWTGMMSGREARRHGYLYELHVREISGVAAFCKDLTDAQKLGRQLAADDMAANNSIAWAAGAPARKAAREAEQAELLAYQERARATAAERARVTRMALLAFVTAARQFQNNATVDEIAVAEKILADMGD